MSADASAGRVARLCRLLGIDEPILLAGMTSVGTARLAVAVSEAGGLGVIAAGRLSAEAFATEIDAARGATRRALGVNIPVMRDTALMATLINTALARDISLVVLGGGNPVPWATRILGAGRMLVIATATPEQARKAEALGAAAVIVAGVEAGGKTGEGEIGGMVAIPAAVAAVSVPVIAAGGIVDGASAAAAICLGAAGVQLGTRFMMTHESPLHPATKQAMVDAGVDATAIIARRAGLARRMMTTPEAMRIRAVETTAELDMLVAMLSGQLSERGLRGGDLEGGTVACGQGVGRITSIENAGDVLRNVAASMRATLDEARRALAF